MEDPEESCHKDTVYGKASMDNIDGTRRVGMKSTSNINGKSTEFFKEPVKQDDKFFNLVCIGHWRPISLSSTWIKGPTLINVAPLK